MERIKQAKILFTNLMFAVSLSHQPELSHAQSPSSYPNATVPADYTRDILVHCSRPNEISRLNFPEPNVVLTHLGRVPFYGEGVVFVTVDEQRRESMSVIAGPIPNGGSNLKIEIPGASITDEARANNTTYRPDPGSNERPRIGTFVENVTGTQSWSSLARLCFTEENT